MDNSQLIAELLQENKQIRRELAEANETLNAIKNGEVDAFLVSNEKIERVFVLNGADHIYRSIVEKMQDGYATLSPDGIMFFCNRNLSEMVKIPLERIVGQSIFSFFEQSAVDAFRTFLKGYDRSFKLECKIKTSENLFVPVIISATKIIIDEDLVICAVLTDLTDQKRSERFAQIIFNQAKEPVIACDSNGRIIKANSAAVAMFGYSLTGKYFDEAIPLSCECDGTRFTLRQALDSKLACAVEVTHETSEGERISLFVSAGRLNLEYDEDIIACVVTLTNITFQRKLDTERARFDRLNLIGEMAAGIGHEVRNPLTTVRGYLQMFQRKQKYADHQEQFSTMIEELDRANLIITDFLSLAKNKRVELIPGDLNATIKALFPLLQAEAFRLGHEIMMDIGEIPEVFYDDKEIRQLILNLARNGMEAMESGGGITIQTYFANDEVILAVKDKGTGIPKEVLDKLGTPFVTTKECGTGLGVSICYRIAERHKAKIDVETSDSGTSFFVKFKPCVTDKAGRRGNL